MKDQVEMEEYSRRLDEQREHCPYFKFVVMHPDEHPPSGYYGCEHASPNIGKMRSYGKECVHGECIGVMKYSRCRIATSWHKEKGAQTSLEEL